MQVVILAGGFGTRISEETDHIPKPMILIGNEPILMHIMKYYASFGHKDFVVALGYKAEIIQEFFATRIPALEKLGWTVNLVDTGLNTFTGGRIAKLFPHLEQEFLMTYGDGLSNVNLDALLAHHRAHGKLATVTAVRPPARFGSMEIENGLVQRFSEKSPQEAGWINGGFFCLNKIVCSYVQDELTAFEGKPIDRLVQESQLAAFDHHGWWQPMDTLRDKRTLEALWNDGNAPWKLGRVNI